MPARWSLIPMPVILALGCAKPQFAYSVDPAFHASSYRSMAVDPRKDRILIREGMRPLNSDLHLKAVLTELGTRNYQPAPTAEADLWVAVYVLMGVSEKSKVGSASPAHREGSGEGHRGGRGGAGSGGPPTTGKEGGTRSTFTVIVQLEDRKTGLPVWQGEANLDHLSKASDGSPLSIEEAVHQLLQPLPSRP